VRSKRVFKLDSNIIIWRNEWIYNFLVQSIL